MSYLLHYIKRNGEVLLEKPLGVYERKQKGGNYYSCLFCCVSLLLKNSGRIYVDEIAEPDYEEVNLDTQRSAKGKANIKNVTQSSPLTF